MKITRNLFFIILFILASLFSFLIGLLYQTYFINTSRNKIILENNSNNNNINNKLLRRPNDKIDNNEIIKRLIEQANLESYNNNVENNNENNKVDVNKIENNLKIEEKKEIEEENIKEIEEEERIINNNNNNNNNNNEIVKIVEIEKESKTQYYRDIIKYVPPLIQAWREAKVDWHQLIPKHDSTWEKFGKGQKGLRVLVAKEEQLTDYLTMFHESGLSAKYGKDHGTLASYSGCNILVDNCMIHNKQECLQNQLCSWDSERLVCIDYTSSIPDDPNQSHGKQCSNPRIRNPSSGFLGPTSPDKCQRWVDQPAGVLNFDSESQSMFYHWLASWSHMMEVWKNRMSQSRHVHLLLDEINDPMLFDFFGTISDYCWRRLSQIPDGVCFCNLDSYDLVQSRSQPEMISKSLTSFFKLESLKPPSTHVKIGIISRRVKRFILNEYDLVDIAQDMGYECILLPLERMTIYEQMKEFRTLDVLVGMHGSGLDNVIFLHPGSVMLQLMPYSNQHRASFVDSTRRANVVYKEWKATDREKSVFHWDLFEQANKEKLMRKGKEGILNEGEGHGDHRETLMFWINQDIIVPQNEWRDILYDCVKSSQASSRGINITPK